MSAVGKVRDAIGVGLMGIVAIAAIKLWVYDPWAEEPPVAPLAATVTAPTDTVRIAGLIHELVNDERQKTGVRQLDYDERLAAIAEDHSRDMAERNFYDHVTPDGKDVQHRYAEARYPCAWKGENLFFHGRDNLSAEDLARSIMDGWINSVHRENILRPQFSVEGIGVVYDDDQHAWLVTQNFC